ncbi:peptidase S8/S53 domain-containing protein [Lactarius pseudohatsudake]|nr:peptidase S8/S53 domain-containing protein [Lactarius pseudohatsudake]
MVKHSRSAVPESWENLGHPPADTAIDLYLELKLRHEEALTDALHVNDPGHANDFSPCRRRSSALRARSGRYRAFTPVGWLKLTSGSRVWLYNTVGYAPAAVDQNVIVTAIYAMEYPSAQDLSAFMAEYLTDGEDTTFTVTQVNGGGYNPNRPGFEANLGLQYAEALTYPTRNIFYSTGGRLNTATGPYLNWLAYLLNLETIPRTISTTYGDPEYSAPKLSLWRVGVTFSSGDWGVGQGDCLVQSSNGRVSAQFLRLPVFAASCPWITSILSRGGFSNYFLRPYNQDIVVPLFLQDVGDIYVLMGTAYPISPAQALNLEIIIDREFEEVDGTSGSAPTVVGIISLPNDYHPSKGEPALGFLNSWLYSFGLPGLNDITLGSNPGCRTDGFPAIAGSDLVTGLGTPDFDKLENIIDDEK